MDPQRGRARGSGMVTSQEEFYLEKEVVQPVPSTVGTVDATHLTRLTREVIKLGAVAFQGGTDYLLADQWIENMETYYDMVVCTDMEKKITATFLLQGEAGRWWDSVLKTRNISTITWEGFVELFRDMYLPASGREKLGVDFISLVQGTMSVKDYEARFSQLYRFVRPMDPVSLARKFQRGLNLVIRDRVTPFQLPTVALIFASALRFEQELLTSQGEMTTIGDSQGKGKAVVESREMTTMGDSQGKGKAVAESSDEMDSHGGSWKRQRTYHQAPARVATALVGQAAHLRCFNCGELGHISRACTKPRCKACFRCGQTGHVARECTRLQNGKQGNQ